MYQTLYDLLHRNPFKPFRVRLSNGKSYTVERPDSTILMERVFVIGWPKRDRFVICDVPEIVAVEPLQRKPPKR